jgi:hypothetical protein
MIPQKPRDEKKNPGPKERLTREIGRLIIN